jgi:hypothetical protein
MRGSWKFAVRSVTIVNLVSTTDDHPLACQDDLMSEPNRVLVKLLERLRSGLLEGPGLNCRPHQSRQRIDLVQLDKLAPGQAAAVLHALLGPEKVGTLTVKLVPEPESSDKPNVDAEPESTPSAEPPAESAETPSSAESHTGFNRRKSSQPTDPYHQQQSLLRKLKVLIEDARIYEQDTGADVLHLGFPLLHVPRGKSRGEAGTRRLLAPLALVPVSLNLKLGARPTVEFVCRADKMDRVIPNPSLLAWLEQSGQRPPDGLLEDETPMEPWEEIAGLARWIAECFGVPLPKMFESQSLPSLESLELAAAPRADDDLSAGLIPAAVVGLYPINNQALLRDMEAMAAGDALDGPVRGFIQVDATLDAATHNDAHVDENKAAAEPAAAFLSANERLVSPADPCQARAVRLARTTAGLVVHGPPGTGKSQTITNIIGDHLLRGQRVLFVSDKRTALDVVADRLSHLGLGGLTAVVHDPGRDQRDLYRSVREQLETLVDRRTSAKAERELARIDQQLDELRVELANAWRLLNGPGGSGEPTFHELVGTWQKPELDTDAKAVYEKAMKGPSIKRAEIESSARDLHDALDKSQEVKFASNPWAACVGTRLDDFLARSGSEIRSTLDSCATTAAQVDAIVSDLPFRPDIALADQVRARSEAAGLLDGLTGSADQTIVAHWLQADPAARGYARARLAQAAESEQVFRQQPLDTELFFRWGANLPAAPELARQIDALGRYAAADNFWKAALALWWRWESNKLLHQYGLPPGRESAKRLHGFLQSCQARRNLLQLEASLMGRSVEPAPKLTDDDVPLLRALDTHHRVLDLLCRSADDPSLEPLKPLVARALGNTEEAQGLIDALRRSAPRAEAIARFDTELQHARLFNQTWLAGIHAQLCEGKPTASLLETLVDALPSCETVVRIRAAVDKLPSALRDTVGDLLGRGTDASQSMAVLDKLAAETAIRSRLVSSPELARMDGQRLTQNVKRFGELRGAKHELACDAALHRWTELQKERLLASTRSRLNSEGADVRRRLTLQGNRAMRLRKVIEIGGGVAGGDPLFDLCPVWMASPETVAQIFPRRPMFDVIVFDEASQCRLEQALPVLTRGRRVVIAGDTKQLPPTRFFETAVVSSENEQAETDQQWFELQQGEVEDLLAGALNLQIEQCYLDVHYRSRNADLIGFSNEQFYGSRLQPIPGHPHNHAANAPITLYHAGGVYEERTNRIEAELVARVVRDLLKRPKPPSIGIACFNTDQRDLIVDCLDELAEEEADFAKRLAEARSRKGDATSEALFVKNLENVQGDERDHLVISTNYGPDRNGRFYRRFGPLASSGGGRRLNVLVTRARQEIHLITSIPQSVYQSLPRLAPGQSPNGAWLLFAYVVYAEHLAELYAAAKAEDERGSTESQSQGAAPVDVHKTPSPSVFAESFARRLAQEQRLPSQVHWGNEGFCVDVAVGHPNHPLDVTVGLLCDLNRYHRAADPVEWEVFRTSILQSQGWQLERVWTPQYFRDPASIVQVVTKSVAGFLTAESAATGPRAQR